MDSGENFSRRSFVTASALGLVGFAGCNQFQNESEREEVPLASAYISNRYPGERTLSVTIEQDGDIVYWENVTVDAYDPDARESGALGGHQIPIDGFGTAHVWRFEILNTHTGSVETVEFGPDDLTDLGARIHITAENDVQIGAPV